MESSDINVLFAEGSNKNKNSTNRAIPPSMSNIMFISDVLAQRINNGDAIYFI